MTRTAISDAFGRNKPAAEIRRALGVLQRSRLAHCREAPPTSGRGRPAETWFAGPQPDEENDGNEPILPEEPGPRGVPSCDSSVSFLRETEADRTEGRTDYATGRVLSDAEIDRIPF